MQFETQRGRLAACFFRVYRENLVLTKFDTSTIGRVFDCLSTGGVVLLPTDTVYGLAVLPTSEQSVDRIFLLKGRPRNVNLPIMVSSQGELETLGFDVNDAAIRLLRSPLIPGSLTLAMGFRSGTRMQWLEGREEAAIRIPKDEWLLSLLRRTGPLLVTSANSHGSETPENLVDVLAQLHGMPDLAIEGGILHTIPSTLVNCRLNPPVVERIGAIPEAEVMEFLK
jgi:L-threonylcarbamoyladenylate synthase